MLVIHTHTHTNSTHTHTHTHTRTTHTHTHKVLVFVLDVAGSEGRDPMEDLLSLREELELYLPGLSQAYFCFLFSLSLVLLFA
jgi:hypothetical protein